MENRHTSVNPMRIALLFRSYGPYHLARLADLRRRASVLALEFTDVDSEYDWRVSEEKKSAGVVSLAKRQDSHAQSLMALDGWLKTFSPDVVAIPGYAEPLALLAACLCQGSGIPALLMSDSHNLNDQRNPIRESLKRRVLSLFHSALVAGTPQKDYLAGLGFPSRRISLGYDVVDNRHFSSVGMLHQTQSISSNLVRPHFLCCSRLVEGKNINLLINAYRRYRDMAGDDAWHLTIAGDGPLYATIARRIAELCLTEHVHLAGRASYEDLPALYAAAGAFVFPSLTETWGLVINEAMAAGLPVLVSKAVGCHRDLVQDGVNGHVFDPADTAQLAMLLDDIATTPKRQAMGEASLRIIRDWDLDRFSSGMIEAAVAAYPLRSRRRSRAAVALATALSYRAHRASTNPRRTIQQE